MSGGLLVAGTTSDAGKSVLTAGICRWLHRRGVKVAPFKVERFGAEFGFIPQPPEEAGEDWSVIVEPGNYMCFWPPWTTGEYDT